MSIADKEQQLLDELSLFQDWTERYEYVISLGKKMAALPAEHHSEQNLLKGCQSQVWLHASYADGKMNYIADSDSVITKGMIALFVRILNGEKPENVLKTNLGFIEKTGLKEHLAPTRANALNLMATEMKRLALEHATIPKN